MEDEIMPNSASARYTDGSYLANNPTWHEEDSPWKAEHVRRMISKNNLALSTVSEVGCGAGGILAELSKQLPVTAVPRVPPERE